MKGLEASILGLSILLVLAAAPAQAQPEPPTINPPPPSYRPPCCEITAGTPIRVELVDQVSTREARSGDDVALRLAVPVVVNGRIILRAGTPGVGVVIEAAKPGMGGKGAKLILAARYLRNQGQTIPLMGLQLAASGKDNSTEANAVGISGIVLGPVGFAGLAIAGGHVVFPAGTTAGAKIAADTYLPSLGPASRKAMAAAAAVTRSAFNNANADAYGSIPIPPPPPGQGLVVFFRKKSLMGTGQWFNVRENGVALGKLANGAYFIQAATPGVHTYTDTTEPEVKDRLRLQVDPGSTYFVEGMMTHGVVMGVADLNPSDRATFEAASGDLKPAPPVSDDSAETPADNQPGPPPDNANGQPH